MALREFHSGTASGGEGAKRGKDIGDAGVKILSPVVEAYGRGEIELEVVEHEIAVLVRRAAIAQDAGVPIQVTGPMSRHPEALRYRLEAL